MEEGVEGVGFLTSILPFLRQKSQDKARREDAFTVWMSRCGDAQGHQHSTISSKKRKEGKDGREYKKEKCCEPEEGTQNHVDLPASTVG